MKLVPAVSVGPDGGPTIVPEGLDDIAPDARSGHFALGCGFYEMVAGRPPFAGDTANAVVDAVRVGNVIRCPDTNCSFCRRWFGLWTPVSSLPRSVVGSPPEIWGGSGDAKRGRVRPVGRRHPRVDPSTFWPARARSWLRVVRRGRGLRLMTRIRGGAR